MEKLTKASLLFFFIAFLIAGTNTYAGKKPFQGIITYKITYPNSSFDATVMSQLPAALNVFYGKDKVKTSMKMASGAQEQITNLEDHSSTALIDIMGQKYAIHSTREEIEKEMEDVETNVEYLDETKEIGGYECKKALVKVKTKKTGDEYTATVYVTEELENARHQITETGFQRPERNIAGI